MDKTAQLIVAVCAGFSTICVAVGWVLKIIRAVKAPTKDLEQRVSALEALSENYGRFFDSDKRRLDAIEKGNAVTQRSILALLRHARDGNNVDDIKSAEDEMQRFLIERD